MSISALFTRPPSNDPRTLLHCFSLSPVSVFCYLLKIPINIQTYYFPIFKKKNQTSVDPTSLVSYHSISELPILSLIPLFPFFFHPFFTFIKVKDLHNHCTIIKTMKLKHFHPLTPTQTSTPYHSTESAQRDYPQCLRCSAWAFQSHLINTTDSASPSS